MGDCRVAQEPPVVELGRVLSRPDLDRVSLHVLAGSSRARCNDAILFVELLFFPTYVESTSLDPVTIAIAVTLGWCANGLYRTHVERRIEKLRPSASSRESLLALLTAQGGTNWLAAIGFAIATPALGYVVLVLSNAAVGIE